jgi:Protein of unknown function (DUF1761)
MGRINHLAVLATVVLRQAIGFGWYHSHALGDAWMNGLDITPDHMKPTAASFGVAILSAFLFSYTVAWLIQRMRADGWFGGFKIGLVLAFAVGGSAIATHDAFFSAAGVVQPIVAVIDIGHDLLAGAVTGALLGAWRKR